MKNKLIIIFLAVVGNTLAQNTLSLQQCIDYALEHHESIKNAQLEVGIAEGRIKETTTIGLPQVTGGVNFSSNIRVQRQFLPASVFDPTAPNDLIVPVAFGITHSAIANVTLNQLLFDGSYFVGLRAAKAFKQFTESSVEMSRVEVAGEVTKAYYGWLVNESRLALLEVNRGQLDQLYKDTKGRVDNGYAEKVDLQRIEVSINNLETSIEQAKNGNLISEYLLKFQMGMALTDSIAPAQVLDSFIVALETPIDPTYSIENRVDYRILNQQLTLQSLNIDNEKIRAYPTVSAFGTFGYNRGADAISEILQFGTWESYSVAGFSINVPIFSSFRRKYRIQQAQGEYDKVENQLSQLKRGVDLEVKTAEINYKNSLEAIKNQEENMTLAEEVYRVTKIKYKEGVSTNFEVVQTESVLQEAQTNYYEALYQAFIAKVNLDKAKGTLVF